MFSIQLRSPINRLFSGVFTRTMSDKGNKTANGQAPASTRPPFDANLSFEFTQVPTPGWVPGAGASSDEWKQFKKIEIDPWADGRTVIDNYKLLVSAVTPRPIGFISTENKDGLRNLSPFSYFALLNHDPPMFAISFSGGQGRLKDTCVNILETEECCVNIISEWFVEAANFTCTNAPLGIDEWNLSGLTPMPCIDVKPAQVAESAMSIECKLVESRKWFSKANPEKQSGTTMILEGVRFHVREDIINDDLNLVDIKKLKPVSRLGGNIYGRTTEGYEISRPDYKTEVEGIAEVAALLDK